ncbi:MAG: DUF4388 domain-containing protein [Chloroflexota bacterium]|nr:DUF4388 domain-containing protein [Chloroflexota bacterium]
MALEGNLEEFNIVAVLQTLAGGEMSGTLSVADGANRAVITFLRGHVIHAESTLEANRIGEILVRTHRITRAQLEQAASAQLRRYPGRRLGQILHEMRVVSDDDLAMAVQIQILEVMARLVLWNRGRWQFQFDPADSPDPLPAGAMSVEEILSGQIILLDNVDPFQDMSAVLDAVYSIVPGRSGDSERVVLEGDEWTVLSAIDGRRSVRELAHATRLDPEQVAHIVTNLGAAGLLTTAAAPSDEPLPRGGEPTIELILAERPVAAAAAPIGNAVIVDLALAERLRAVLATLLARAEGHEVCLISSSGSLLAFYGESVHLRYPALFALAAGIFASWQELGRSLGENKASTLLYQGADLNICLSPVGTQAILMTLYSQASRGGLVNFWSRAAGIRLARLLGEGAGAGGPGPALRPRDPPPGSRPPRAEAATPDLGADFQADVARQMDDLFRNRR